MSAAIKPLQVGETRLGRPRTLSMARALALSGGAFDKPGWPDKNLHTDPVAAADAGLSAVVVSGTQWEGYVVGLLVDTFGAAWFDGGIIDIKIPRSVKIGETLQPGLCLEALIEADGQTRAHVNVWCRNADGEDVMAGTASCVVAHLGNRADTAAANAPARA